jgi:hypothetical protein
MEKDAKLIDIQVSQNPRIPNSERGREGPSGARKILKKKFALPEEDISTLILFNIQGGPDITCQKKSSNR